MMRIITASFDLSQDNRYERLLQVFERSCRAQMPGVEIQASLLPAPDVSKVPVKGFATNTAKLDAWVEALRPALAAGQEVMLSDCDMLCLRDVRDVWSLNFDVAYTTRTGGPIANNGGVVFLQPTERALEFMEAWQRVNRRMFEDHQFHRPWRIKYAGMNQASFGYLLEHPEERGPARLLALPCSEWNACNEDWATLAWPLVRLVHFKGKLRRYVLDPGTVPPGDPLERLVAEWGKYAA